jgi:FxsC-like protein
VLPAGDEWVQVMVQFFLSYSGEDGQSDYVLEFLTDLQRELSLITAISQQNIGYGYGQAQAGTRWPSALTRALGTCKVFVPLYSPFFFKTEACGKEWWVFEERLRHCTDPANGNNRPAAIIPIMWEMVMDNDTYVPKAARDIWAWDPRFGAVYRERGLRQMVQLRKKYVNEYPEFVMALAKHIKDLARETDLPPLEVSDDFDGLCNAFEISGPGVESLDGGLAAPEAALQRSQISSHPRVTLAVASSTLEEAATIRSDVSTYGADQDEWAPYAQVPEGRQPAALYAMDVAREMSFWPQTLSFDDRMEDLLDRAEQSSELAVVILDPWTTKIEKRCAALTAYDRRLSRHVALVVPRSTDDPESEEHGAELDRQVVDILNRHAHTDSLLLRMTTGTVAAFKETVRDILSELSRIALNGFQVARPVGSATAIPLVSNESEREE